MDRGSSHGGTPSQPGTEKGVGSGPGLGYPAPAIHIRHACISGEVAEWSIAPHSKCGVRVTVPGVRIPPSPPLFSVRALILLIQFVGGQPLPHQMPHRGRLHRPAQRSPAMSACLGAGVPESSGRLPRIDPHPTARYPAAATADPARSAADPAGAVVHHPRGGRPHHAAIAKARGCANFLDSLRSTGFQSSDKKRGLVVVRTR